jgi:hypothetical protein
MTTVTKLDKFFGSQLKSDIQDVLITKDNTGRYSLFGKYFITPRPNGYYRVTGNITLPIEFAQLKNAVTWCTLINANKYKEAKRVEELDLKLSSIDFDLSVHRTILKKKTDADQRWLYINKIQEDIYKRRLIIEEINSHINNSKTIQFRKFEQNKKPNFKFM